MKIIAECTLVEGGKNRNWSITSDKAQKAVDLLEKNEKVIAFVENQDGYIIALLRKITYAKDGSHIDCKKNVVNVMTESEFYERMGVEQEEEKEIDWSKIPVDTPILVRSDTNKDWIKAHFAEYNNGNVLAWFEGNTSWTSNLSIAWKYAKLEEEEQ